MAAIQFAVLLWCVSGASFTCKDGSRTIDAAFREDGFCDCTTDGSDELTTGACSVGNFSCLQWPLEPKSVFASRVGDSICDCCDGADERDNPRVQCADECRETAEAELTNLEEAAAAGAQAKAEGQRQLAAWKESEQALLGEVTETNRTVAAILGSVVTLREARDRRRAALHEAARDLSVLRLLRTDALTKSDVELATARLSFLLDDNPLEELVDFLAEHDDESVSDLMDSVPLDRVVGLATPAESEAPGAEDGPGVDTCEAATPCGREQQLLDMLPLGEVPRDVLLDITTTLAVKRDDLSKLALVVESLHLAAGRGATPVAAKSSLEGLSRLADGNLDEREADLKLAEAKLANATRLLEDVRRNLAVDYGENGALVTLRDKCVEGDFGGHDYQVCLFETFRQGHVSVGKYRGSRRDEGQLVVTFSDGDACGEEPRSGEVTITCGVDLKLVSVTEDRTCFYNAVLKSPLGCDERDLRGLRARLAQPRPTGP